MPQLASFGGVVVMVYFGDHPPPHVHVRLGRPGKPGVAEARFSIDTGELIDGASARRTGKPGDERCLRNREALRVDWERAERGESPIERYDLS
jgi:hypothetical protein